MTFNYNEMGNGFLVELEYKDQKTTQKTTQKTPLKTPLKGVKRTIVEIFSIVIFNVAFVY